MGKTNKGTTCLGSRSASKQSAQASGPQPMASHSMHGTWFPACMEQELQGLRSYRAECHDMYACISQLVALLGMGAPAETPAGPTPAATSLWLLSATFSSGLPRTCLGFSAAAPALSLKA